MSGHHVQPTAVPAEHAAGVQPKLRVHTRRHQELPPVGRAAEPDRRPRGRTLCGVCLVVVPALPHRASPLQLEVVFDERGAEAAAGQRIADDRARGGAPAPKRTREYWMRGIVCYSHRHYVSFYFYPKYRCWVQYNDSHVTKVAPLAQPSGPNLPDVWGFVCRWPTGPLSRRVVCATGTCLSWSSMSSEMALRTTRHPGRSSLNSTQ